MKFEKKRIVLSNDYLETLAGENATYLNVTGNITLGEKITFTLGEIIDNMVDGWIRITGNLQVDGDVNVTGSLNISENITADYYFGSGESLTDISTYNSTYEGYATNVSRNWTLDTYTNWNAVWSAMTTIWDADFNISFSNLDSDTAYTNSSFDLSQISNTGNVDLGDNNFTIG